MSEPLQTTEPEPFRIRPSTPPIRIVAASHPGRSEIEAFIERRYEAAFGAKLPSHYPVLVGRFASDGALLAAAGVRFPEREDLFLERYIDVPVEQAVARVFGRPVARETLVEIGSLASVSPTASLELFTALAEWLTTVHARRFAVATARPDLTRLLERAGFSMRVLGEAEPSRLGDGARDWGRYYDRNPQVFAGEIGVSPALPLLRQRLRAKMAERQARRLRSTAL